MVQLTTSTPDEIHQLDAMVQALGGHWIEEPRLGSRPEALLTGSRQLMARLTQAFNLSLHLGAGLHGLDSCALQALTAGRPAAAAPG